MEVFTPIMKIKIKKSILDQKDKNGIAQAIQRVQDQVVPRRRKITINELMESIDNSQDEIHQFAPNRKKIEELAKSILEIGLLNRPKVAFYNGSYYLLGGRHRSLALFELSKLEREIRSNKKDYELQYSEVLVDIFEISNDVSEDDFREYITRQIVSDNSSRVMSSCEKDSLETQMSLGARAKTPFEIFTRTKGDDAEKLEKVLKTYIPTFYEDELGKASYKTFIRAFVSDCMGDVDNFTEESVNFICEMVLKEIRGVDSNLDNKSQVANFVKRMKFVFGQVVQFN